MLDIAHGVDVGDRDFDDREVAGLRLTHPDPLRSVELSFRGDDLDLEGPRRTWRRCGRLARDDRRDA